LGHTWGRRRARERDGWGEREGEMERGKEGGRERGEESGRGEERER
jgi:hypothetical protein